VVEKSEKEYMDLLAAFTDFDVTNGTGQIRGNEIAELCSKDWGIYTTFWKSLESLLLSAETIALDERVLVVPRVRKLMGMMDAEPKTFGWRMRARIGEKARWYDLPDKDADSMLA
jgi:hypothetical protein